MANAMRWVVMDRVRRGVGLHLLLLTSFIIGACASQGEKRPPPEPPAVIVPEPSPAVAKLLFVGDIMLARRPGEAVAHDEDPFASFAPVLQEADLAIGNLECAIATVGEALPKAYTFRCHPRVVLWLSQYMDAVSVANNHSGDFGKEAFAEELTFLERGGVDYFGGGRNLKAAHSPLILESKGMRIALLGYGDVELRSYEAGPTTPGTAWLDEEQALADIAAARAKADLVVVYPHWGLEYHRQPSERQQTLAHAMIDAGANLVVGAHPHVTQTVERYKNGLILYSLGNFIFDDFLDVSADLQEPARISWLLRVEVTRSGITRWDTLVARTDDQGLPRPVHGVKSPCGDVTSDEIRMCAGE